MRFKGISEQLASGLRKGIVGIAMVLCAGVLGYRLIEGWNWSDSFYMTVITVSTVGFGEIQPLSGAGRIFTALLIFFGVGVNGFCLTRLG